MKLMSWESAENDLVQSELCADDRTLARHHHHADVNRKRVALFFFVRLDWGVEPFAAEWIPSSSKVIGRHCPPAGAQGRARPAAAAAAATTTTPQKNVDEIISQLCRYCPKVVVIRRAPAKKKLAGCNKKMIRERERSRRSK